MGTVREGLLREGLKASADEFESLAKKLRAVGQSIQPTQGVIEQVNALLATADDAPTGSALDAERAQIEAACYRGALKQILENARGPLETLARNALQMSGPRSEDILRKVRIFDQWAKAQLAREGLFDQESGKLKAGRTETDLNLAESDIRRGARDAVSFLVILQAEGRE
jgi:hypothetical protein